MPNYSHRYKEKKEDREEKEKKEEWKLMKEYGDS